MHPLHRRIWRLAKSGTAKQCSAFMMTVLARTRRLLASLKCISRIKEGVRTTCERMPGVRDRESLSVACKRSLSFKYDAVLKRNRLYLPIVGGNELCLLARFYSARFNVVIFTAQESGSFKRATKNINVFAVAMKILTLGCIISV